MKRRPRRWPPEGKKFNTFCRKYLRMHLLKWWQLKEAVALHKVEYGERPTMYQAATRALRLHKSPEQIDQIWRSIAKRVRARNRIARGKK